MRSTQVFTVFALLTASVSSLSIGHASNQLVHRRHAAEVTQNSVLQARAARKPVVEESDIAERDENVPRSVGRRGINQRRCAAKSSSSTTFPSSTSVAAVNEAATSAPHSTSTRERETTSTRRAQTSQAQSTTSSPEAKYTKTSATTTKATKTSTSAQATSTSDSGSSSGSTYTGEGTFYGTGLGACGITNTDTDYICAVAQSMFDGFEGYTGSDPNSNPICNKKLKATYQGKSVTVTVTDRCVGCAYGDLDFSPSAFSQLADQSVGRLTGVTWAWV